MSQAKKLTKNQSLVLDVLANNAQPMSAYSILDKLRAHGLRAPLQVYRALDALMATGSVHRLETLNAFVACSHSKCDAHSSTAFTICSKCGVVAEIDDSEVGDRLSLIAENREFDLQKSTIELHGICRKCQMAA